MRRRHFCTVTAAATATGLAGTARAQAAAPDPNLLKTTLTPFGAERAGNADGSIPAWTGGWTSAPIPTTQSFDVPIPFANEAMLYKVSGGNVAQYQDLVSVGVQAMIAKFGFYLKVYPTHRTAAAPQYVYDNMAKNVVNAKLDPAGGRFGFTGAYAGLPFPIIDTSDPLAGGAQLIWNHLVHWEGYMNYANFAPAIVSSNGQPVLTAAEFSRSYYPFYDPDGSAASYTGYYRLIHTYEQAPPDVVGQEELIWASSNTNVKPDIVWTLLNGQGRVRKAPNEQYDTPNPLYNGIANIDESQAFNGDPSKYDWTYIAKKEMLVPYNNNAVHFTSGPDLCLPRSPNPETLRWEKHRMWIVEAVLHPGERNVLRKRRLYIDEDTGQAVMGEAYDADNNLTRAYLNPLRTVPSIPMTNPAYVMTQSLLTGDYVINGNFNYPGHPSREYTAPQPSSAFDATQMAASASF